MKPYKKKYIIYLKAINPAMKPIHFVYMQNEQILKRRCALKYYFATPNAYEKYIKIYYDLISHPFLHSISICCNILVAIPIYYNRQILGLAL